MAVVVAFGCMSYRPQKAYAFAPAAVPIVITLLGLSGIFVTGVYSTSDLFDKMNDFVMSDDEIYNFIEELSKEHLGSTILLTSVRLAFLANYFIDYARSYFNSSGSDTFSEGMIFRDFKELDKRLVPVTVPLSYDWGSYSYSGNKLISYSKSYPEGVEFDAKVWGQITSISPVPFYAFQLYSYQSTYVKIDVVLATSFGLNRDYPFSSLGASGSNNYITLGNVTYMTPTYAKNKGYTLTSGYVVDDSVNVSAVKASILEAETATLKPVQKEAGIYDFTTILDVYDGGLIDGVTLDPDAVIDDPIVVDPEVPITPDLTGIAGALAKILSWLKAIPKTIVGEGSLDFSAFNDIKLSGLFPFCIPFDLINSFKVFNVPPKEPVWTVEFSKTPMVGMPDMVIDMREYNWLFSIGRFFIYISFVIGLIIITRNIIKGDFMIMALLQSILNGFASLLKVIMVVLPTSPFAGLYSISINSDWLGYACYFLPITQILALLQAWGTAILVYYVYMIPMRYIKALN